MSEPTKKPKPNWAEIEKEVRDGEASIRDIARKHGVSEAAIRKKAKNNGWERAVVAPKRPERKSPVAITYIPPSAHPEILPSAHSANPEDLAKAGRGLAGRLLNELDAVTAHVGELEQMIELETADDKDGRRYAAMMKAISLPMRASTLRSLAQAIETLSKGAVPDGKKARQQEAADALGGSDDKYAVPRAPRLVVDNK